MKDNIDNITICVFFAFLLILSIIFVINLKFNFFYFKNNNYTSYNLIFLVLFSGILFTFLYVIVNFIISQYNLININNDNELSISDENKKDIKYIEVLSGVFLSIFLLIFLIHIFLHMINNQYTFINNTYKVHIVWASIGIVGAILGIYFGV